MFNFVISLLLAIIVTVVLNLLLGVNFLISSAVGVAVFAGAFILITRFIMKKIGALMESAQRDLQAGRGEKAVKTLQSGFKYAPWQVFIKGQLNAQIGVVLYLKRDFAEAFEYLQKGFVRHWVAMGMLAICYMKRNKTAKMIETFEKTTAATKKEPMLWNLYGYCLERVGEKEKAIAVMEKGVKKVGGHELLQSNLDALKEGRKMKMLGWGDLWYQFHLEKTGAIIRQQTKAIQGRRKIVRR
jgi:tetratricopeptide (TPR) repeat protein